MDRYKPLYSGFHETKTHFESLSKSAEVEYPPELLKQYHNAYSKWSKTTPENRAELSAELEAIEEELRQSVKETEKDK